MKDAGFGIDGGCGVGLQSLQVCLEVWKESEEHLRSDLSNVQ